MNEPTFDALYYPFSMCMTEQALKRMLLLFDHIDFIHPRSSGFALPRYDPPAPLIVQCLCLTRPRELPSDLESVLAKQEEEIASWSERFAELEEEGIIIAVDPEPIVNDNDRLITNATLIDCESQEFNQSVTNALIYEFGAKDYLKRYRKEYEEAGHDLQEIFDRTIDWPIGVSGVPPSLRDEWFRVKYSGDALMRSPIEQGIPVAINPSRLGTNCAAALALNRALVTSVALGKPLVTDNPHFESMLVDKTRRLLDTLRAIEDKKANSTIGAILSFLDKTTQERRSALGCRDTHSIDDFLKKLQRVESQRLVNIALSNIVADKSLERISLDKVLKYRESSKIERQALLAAIYQWACEVEAMIGDERDPTEISQRIYAAKVLPEVNRYRRVLGQLDKRLVPELLGTTCEGLGLSLTTTVVGSFVAGLTLEQALILYAAIASPIVGRAARQLLNHTIRRTEARMDSPLAYLLNVR